MLIFQSVGVVRLRMMYFFRKSVSQFRSGLGPIEFVKGKAAIAAPSLDKLPTVIDTLIAAVRNGELDEQLALVGKISAKRHVA